MPQSHPATGPVRFLSPAGFLARKAEWSARRNFTSVLFPWSHQATGPVRLDTPAYCWFGRIIRRTPRVPRTISYGPHTGIFYVFHILRYPCGARAWPARVPYGCLQSQNPYGARKLIMHALKLYGPRTGRQNSYGAARGPYEPHEWTYVFCSKQPVDSPETARTGPGSVMWLRHNSLRPGTHFTKGVNGLKIKIMSKCSY